MEYVTLKEAYGPHGLKTPKRAKEERPREPDRDRKESVDKPRPPEVIQGFQPWLSPSNEHEGPIPMSPWDAGNRLVGATVPWTSYAPPVQNRVVSPAMVARHNGMRNMREAFADAPSFEEDVKKTIALGLFGLLLIFAMDHVCSRSSS